MQLPSSCEGCPFYVYRNHPSNSFTPDYYVDGSQVLFLAQNPGANEAEGHQLIRRRFTGKGTYSDEYREVEPQPLIGKTGQDFNTKYLPLAGLKRSEVSVANAIRCRPALAMKAAGVKGIEKADDLPTITSTMRIDNLKGKADIVKALRHCKATHLKIPDSVHTVVTMGRHAMFQMTGLSKDLDEYKKKQSVLESWRGYGVDCDYHSTRPVDTSTYHALRSGRVVFFTMHIAALNYGDNKKFTHATLQDFHKLGMLLRKEWPLPVPEWSNVAPKEWPAYSSFDTEYNPDTKELYRWSMCDSNSNLWCVESDDTANGGIPIQHNSTVLIQNALADIRYLASIVQFDKIKIEDLMLAHSVLWSGEPHSLNYLNSVYGSLNRYKHLSSDTPQAYSAYDAYEPMQMWKGYFIPEFKRDPESWKVYKRFRLPLIEIIDKAQRSGALLDSSRLEDVKFTLIERLQEYKKRAVEITGNSNFNLGGNKGMREELYG